MGKGSNASKINRAREEAAKRDGEFDIRRC